MLRFIRPALIMLALASPAAALDQDSLRARKAPGGVELSWTDPTPTVACLVRDETPPPATLLQEVAGLSHVDPAPGVPILFYSVDEPAGGTCGTPPVRCAAVAALACDVALTSATDAVGSTDVVDAYTGCTGPDATGPEIAYAFTALRDGTHVVSLANAAPGLGLRILRDAAGECDPAQCQAYDDVTIDVTLAAGESIFVVVDGQSGASGAFDLTVACPAPPTPTCASAGPLACGATITARTDGAGSADLVDDWTACAGQDASGPEIAHAFTATSTGTHVATLRNAAPELDLRLLRDAGAGCDPAQCLAFDDSTITFDAIAGATYYLVVDGRAGAAGSFDLELACPSTGGSCAPVAALSCGGLDSRNTGDAGSSRVLANFPGCFAGGLDGSEMVYSFTAPEDDSIEVRLLAGAGAADVLVLEDAGAGCETAPCIAFGDVSADFLAVAGRTYFVVVDSPAGPGITYEVALTCRGRQCQPDQTLLCGQAIAHNTAWPVFTDVNDSYPCSGFDYSGPEYTFRFTATGSGQATATLSGATAELDVFVLAEAAGCTPDACIATGDADVTFPIAAGETYDIVVDGRDGAEGFFRLDLSCTSPPSACEPHATLRCGDLAGNDTAAGRDAIDAWPACTGLDLSGPEYVFLFAPIESAMVRIVMDLNMEDLDILVVRDDGAGCDPTGCIAWGDSEVTFDAAGGSVYYVVVDGRAGVSDIFRLWMDCQRVPGACRPAQPIACGETVSGRNDAPGSTDAIDRYDCLTYPEDGPEFTYTFVPAADGTVRLTLSNLTGDLDLFVLRDDGLGCNQQSCIAGANLTLDVDVVAGETYYVVVEGFTGAVGGYDLSLECP